MELFCELTTRNDHCAGNAPEVNARYGRRIIELRDGWMTRDEILSQRQRRAGQTVKQPRQLSQMYATRSAILLLQVNWPWP